MALLRLGKSHRFEASLAIRNQTWHAVVPVAGLPYIRGRQLLVNILGTPYVSRQLDV
jgi:hypothetical protein